MLIEVTAMYMYANENCKVLYQLTGTKTRLIIPLRPTDIVRMQTLGSYFNVLLMYMKYGMSFIAYERSNDIYTYHNSSMNLRLG